MEHTTTTAPATSEQPDLSHVVEAALDAFWDVVVDHYPLATTGDLSPLTTVALDRAAANAVGEWVQFNVPSAA